MITVQLLQPTDYHISLFGDPLNRVFLDTDEDFGIRLTKALEQLSEVEQITQEAALSVAIDSTDKNKLLLEDINLLYAIEVKEDGETLPLDKFRIITDSDRDRQFELEFFGNGWIQDLRDLSLSSLDLGIFQNTIANVLASWADQTAMAVSAPSDFGAFQIPGQLSRRDCRIRINLLKLMQKAFCEIGWEFKSPYYESTVGSRLYAYLADEKWFSYEGKNDIFKVDVNIASPRVLDGTASTILFDEVSDPLDLYNSVFRPFEYLYPPAGETGIDLRIIIENLTIQLPPIEAGGKPGLWFILIYRNRPPGFTFEFFETFQGSRDQTITRTFNYDFIAEDTRPGDSFGVIIGYQTQDGAATAISFVLESCDVTFSPDARYYIDDDDIDIASAINPDLNGEKLYKAMVHICAGKTLTDYNRRRVTLYPPFDITIQNELVEGYFIRNKPHIDLTNLVVPRSRIITVEEKEEKRIKFLKFKDSTDEYIKNFTPEEDPWSRKVDIGYGKVEEEKIENDLFEPTIDISRDPALTGGTGVDGIFLPAMWDNTSNEISNKIGARIGYHYGLIEQVASDGTTIDFNFEGIPSTFFGLITQIPVPSFVNGDPIIPIAFQEFQEDLYRLFYKRWIREQFSKQSMEFLVYISLNQYLEMNFRERFGFFYKDAFLFYQGLSIKDFDVRGRTSTPIGMKKIEC